ncbi:hypothetical protein B0T24DRAFT_625166 [Lasiosphaeria ovina]|uniref:Uncharacterized protein n=1 Tax=Lasiosphaeria ovina TaxID=92902 RepID=A0AAE0KD57_9PEZI|nr:hypothetical protein B0T24DRAFT_625166 [Lasiosphaeria ovina]
MPTRREAIAVFSSLSHRPSPITQLARSAPLCRSLVSSTGRSCLSFVRQTASVICLGSSAAPAPSGQCASVHVYMSHMSEPSFDRTGVVAVGGFIARLFCMLGSLLSPCLFGLGGRVVQHDERHTPHTHTRTHAIMGIIRALFCLFLFIVMQAARPPHLLLSVCRCVCVSLSGAHIVRPPRLAKAPSFLLLHIP